MSNKGIHDALEMLARRGVPENINLWQRISSKLNRRFSMLTLRKHPFAAILIALIVFLVVSGGVYALGKTLGFIPGSGFVDKHASIRVLKEPVSSNHNDLQITIDQVVADSVQTTIYYTIDINGEATLKPGAEIIPGAPVCESLPDFVSHSLRLPDGQTVPGGSGGPDVERPYDEDGSTKFKVSDPPIPQDVDTFTFVLGCNQGEVTVQLVPAPKDFVLQVNTVAPQETMGITETTTPVEAIAVTDHLHLDIESYVEMDDGYILVGYRQHDQQDERNFLPASFENISVTDANGTSVEVHDVPQSQNYWPAETNPHRDYWVIKVLGKDYAWPLTVTHQSIIELSTEEVTTFQIDLGANPQAGQSWNLDLDVSIENIGTLRVDYVSLFKGTAPLEDPNSYRLEFSITYGNGESPQINLVDKEHGSQFLGGGAGPEGCTIQIIYPSGFIPSGPLTITVVYSGQIPGPVLDVDWKP